MLIHAKQREQASIKEAIFFQLKANTKDKVKGRNHLGVKVDTAFLFTSKCVVRTTTTSQKQETRPDGFLIPLFIDVQVVDAQLKLLMLPRPQVPTKKALGHQRKFIAVGTKLLFFSIMKVNYYFFGTLEAKA